jgi:hypothetical protein
MRHWHDRHFFHFIVPSLKKNSRLLPPMLSGRGFLQKPTVHPGTCVEFDMTAGVFI